MTDQIKEFAEQAGFVEEFAVSGLWLADDEELERFTELVAEYAAAKEREMNRELLEALKEIASETYDEWTNGAKAQRIAQAAIAKAEEQA